MSKEVFCTKKIKEKLPHGYPMLLVDRICKESDNKFIGLKNVSTTDEFFNGHFPEFPIMPGVLQLEAAQQVAVFAVKDELDPEDKNDIYIKSLSRIKFRAPVTPGDRIQINVEIKKIENNEASFSFVNKIKTGVSTQGDVVLAIRPREYNVEFPELHTEYDKTNDVEMDILKLKEHMQHRYPFLFIDYIHSSSFNGEQKVTAMRNITSNDTIMHTYSDDYSVLPASVQCEIIAQAGCAHTMANPENAGKLPNFGIIPKAEFYHPIHPGDQLRIELTQPGKATKVGKGFGTIYVGDKKVAYGEVVFILINLN